jgi:hypothetical protein
MTADPLILYIPGLKPKPQADVHRQQLRRCLLAGLGHIDAGLAAEVAAKSHAFDIVSWTWDFYEEHRDIALDLPDIDALLGKNRADASDIAEATSWRRRLLGALYRAGDRMPFLIPKLADENMDMHLRDLRRYVQNINDVAEVARRHLKVLLRAAHKAGRSVALLAHSMGSVIAWDALWQLSHDEEYDGTISLFMTLGSPLGLRYVQRRLLGASEAGIDRYPHIIERWINIAAIGELTALDRNVANDFAEMNILNLLRSIEDVEVYNWFRHDGTLNVHAEYGYLANRETAARVAAWWREQTP